MSKLLVCAGSSENFKFAVPIGIGLIDSAINLTKILSNLETKSKTSEIIFIGTGGLYRDGKILEIYESSFAVQHEISEIENFSYSPIMNKICPDVSRETLVINSSNFVTTSEKYAYKFANLGYFIENMEFYSVYKVSKFFGIPCSAIICSTNFCNEKAHSDFIKNHNLAKIKIEKYIKEKGLI